MRSCHASAARGCATTAAASPQEKKRAHRDDTYWGRPVPGFGDPAARLLLVGLAPAAHGANRTGRVFTGDGAGGSGDFLMSALHRTGFANIPTSQHPDDGLRLTTRTSCRRSAARRPTTSRCPKRSRAASIISTRRSRSCRDVRVVVALGKIAFDAWLQLLRRRGVDARRRGRSSATVSSCDCRRDGAAAADRAAITRAGRTRTPAS